MNRIYINKVIFILIGALIVHNTQAKTFIVYPINENPFEADSLQQNTDSVKVFSQFGTRIYAWEQLFQIKDDEGETIRRVQMSPLHLQKQEELMRKNSNVIMRPVKSYPMKWVSIPSALLLSFGIYEITQSQKHFRNARNLEKDGQDPTNENNMGNRTRTIGFATSFVGISGIIISMTPQTSLKPYFTYDYNQSIQCGIMYETAILAFRN